MRFKIRAKIMCLIQVLLILWMACASIAFFKYISSKVLKTGNANYMGGLNIRDIFGTSINPIHNVTDTSSTCLKVIDIQEIYKKLWPPVAVPGDLGYGGAGILVNKTNLTDTEGKIYDNGLTSYQVNQIASEKIPLRRNITLDMPECNNITYNTTTLPTVGVVLIFTDEMWTALMRTVFSILDAGPIHLINEIILVDDASLKDHLRKPLDDYIRIFDGKVKVVRLPTRKGLIAARLEGFKYITGEVAVFLDGHCEVPRGWLEPLLHRIKQDESVIAVPNTDILKWETFEFNFISNKDHHRCGFQFNMRYNWIPIPLPDGIKRKTLADPVETPVHMGCCFAVSKKNFERLGGYDPNLEIWGCENLELSFKTWMCGGRLEIIPCSHIAHMYRPKFPYSWAGKPHTFERNCLRVAEVWMDEYKQFYQDRISNLQDRIDIGDVSERKAIRARLNCRSFDWYVKKIYPDIYIPTNTTAIGSIANVRISTVCLEIPFSKQQSLPTPKMCNSLNQDQYLYLTKEKQIRRDDNCVSYDVTRQSFMNRKCKDDKGQWEYTEKNTIQFIGTDKCVTLTSDNKQIIMAQCNDSDTSQQWQWPRRSIQL